MAELLQSEKREAVGKRANRRLRRNGQVPAVIYGHGEASISLALDASEVQSAIRHGAKLVELQGAVTDSALLREVQWDAMGTEILHLDLTRVSAEETVEVEVQVELRGESPGTKEGGVVAHQLHTVTIRCPAAAIPDKLEVSINDLHVGQAIKASEIPLPEKAELVIDLDTIVAQCAEAGAQAETEEPIIPGAAEPEVIGRKAEDEDES